MKKVLSIILCCALLCTLSVPAFAAYSGRSVVKQIEAGINADRFTVKEIEAADVPDDVVVMEFDTAKEAVAWINSLSEVIPQTKIDSVIPGYEQKGDVGWVEASPIPDDGWGTITYSMEYEVPGMSAQVVTSEHYFEYEDNKVIDWSVYTEISGIGLATYDQTYDHLEKVDTGYSMHYIGSCVGDLGYYISVGGTNIGVYEQLELTHSLYYYYGN